MDQCDEGASSALACAIGSARRELDHVHCITCRHHHAVPALSTQLASISNLDDRILRDIGLDRGALRSAAWEMTMHAGH